MMNVVGSDTYPLSYRPAGASLVYSCTICVTLVYPQV